ncbi:VOC family protein [Corynebacterium sp. P5848]|uniref:VOC family protein n=1 Tax=Corynebacterium marambiense TaxID=2765364 RepID=UPI002260BF56|nr:VOC family protein [Corynebacterium marambiense]MCX7543087.1 VOC family protein [Corynebacterium marambiense]
MDETIIHAELDFDCGRLQLGAAQAALSPACAVPGAEDVRSRWVSMSRTGDRVIETATARGAVLREAVVGFVSGDRYGSIRDPFGIRRSPIARIEDLSDEESARRIDEWAYQR